MFHRVIKKITLAQFFLRHGVLSIDKKNKDESKLSNDLHSKRLEVVIYIT